MLETQNWLSESPYCIEQGIDSATIIINRGQEIKETFSSPSLGHA
jgi:hypothetical protein